MVTWIQEYVITMNISEVFNNGDRTTLIHDLFRGGDAVFKTYVGEKKAILFLNLLTKVT
jgi:hypothetical protein